jgi:ABC-type branched-subunit amino acid transport system substrate-binding protein
VTRERSFPPGIGWWQTALALTVLVIAASVTAAPRFKTSVVGTASGDDARQVVGSAQPGQAQGSAGPMTQQRDANGKPIANGAMTTAAPGAIDCAHGRNGGKTAPGVTDREIRVASTVVTSGAGSGFLGEAGLGIKAALQEANAAGGVCGRLFYLDMLNSGWDGPTGKNYIEGWIHAGKTFALVGQPDSEGLHTATESRVIDNNKMPVVGTDGLLRSQYHSEWIWPVAASTVANMHIIADYAIDVLHKTSFGIVYDTDYKFGEEGATAFAEQVKRRGYSIKGYGKGKGCSPGNGAFCGISSNNQNYNSEVQNFNAACKPCGVVVMLVEPGPMISWMNQEENQREAWYETLIGGEPLLDDRLGQQCAGCGKAKLMVWSGYRPAIQPFDAEKPVYTYCQQLHAVSGTADCHNEFTEGAYLGGKMFVEAVRRIAALNLPLTRENLKVVLDAKPFDLGLTKNPLAYPGVPHVANVCMTAFADNYSGSFNGWNYLQSVGWRCDPNPLFDL